MKRVLIIINKSWEADAALGAMLTPKARPPGFDVWKLHHPFSVDLSGAMPASVPLGPRAICQAGPVHFEVWCVEDWMGTANHSSSLVKIKTVLPAIFGHGPKPDFVVAVGTAAYADKASCNGCVTMGAQNFIHNPYRNPDGTDQNPTVDWNDGAFLDVPLTSDGGTAILKSLTGNLAVRLAIESRLLPAPRLPATPPVLLFSTNYVAVSDVNVTHYDDYAWADPEAVTKCHAASKNGIIASVETTHGLIRAMSSGPYIFISGIVNRLGYLNADIGSLEYAQNKVGAHNAGVTAINLFPIIAAAL